MATTGTKQKEFNFWNSVKLGFLILFFSSVALFLSTHRIGDGNFIYDYAHSDLAFGFGLMMGVCITSFVYELNL